MRDRYYSNELHRFLSLDKDQGDLYRPSTLNPYAYVGNDPINFIDPSGMTAVNIANALKNAVFNEDGSINWGGVLELGKVALSFTPVGWIVDLYDLGKSILEFDWTWGGLADIGLNAVGFLPGIGDLAKGGGKFIKTADAIADGVDLLSDAGKAITKAGGLFIAGKAAKNVGNGAEAFADSSKAAKALNRGSDALDTANDAGKALKNADEVGSALKSSNNFKGIKLRTRAVDPSKTIYKVDDFSKISKSSSNYVELSKNSVKHIRKHNVNDFIKQANHMDDVQLTSKLKGNTFFNPNWSREQISENVEQAYNHLRSQGKTGEKIVEIDGEIIGVYITPDGNFHSSWGMYEFTVEDIRKMSLMEE